MALMVIRWVRFLSGPPSSIKDVCDVLELGNVSKAVSRLDSEDKSDTFLNDVTGRFQSMLIISEAGLYQLVMTSEKKEAKTFRRWVLHEVLPDNQIGSHPSSI